MELHWLGQATLTAYLVVLTLLCIYGVHRYFLVMTFYRVRGRNRVPAGQFDELPRITIQLPMYNEQYVAERIIEGACRVEYPRDRLEIQVLDDSTDNTREIAQRCVERMRVDGVNIVYLHREDRTGYKAGALEAGLKTATGEFVAIFDADFVPPPNILLETVHHFTDPKIGMVQCRWEHLNRGDSLLTEAQAILLDGHFMIEHTARNRTGRYMSFNGTAGVWRRAAIQDAGGWSHDTLTEDLDLSYRAQLRGWQFVFLPNITSPAELPPEMNAFKAQQHRWTKGGAQTCVKLLPTVMRSKSSLRVKVEAFFHLTSCMVYILMVLLSILVGPALIYKVVANQEMSTWEMAFDFVLFFIGTGSALAFYIVSQRQLLRSWTEIFRYIPALMAIGIGIAFNNAIAAIEGFFGKSGEFFRTPKFGDKTQTLGNWQSRLSGFSFKGAWKAWAELGMAAYLSVCLCSFFFFEHWVERVSAAIRFRCRGWLNSSVDHRLPC
ncbi:MAG: glycosyltransferase [Planctomycetes bacterium]|nr:glycosyltransferase [Planctomycetota bacterium]